MKIGVFLCKCGQRIAQPVDLSALVEQVAKLPGVALVDTVPYPCLEPGLAELRREIKARGLDRVVVAGCEARILQKKFQRGLAEAGIAEGQFELVNLRDHVAAVHDLPPKAMADKGAKLIAAAVAGLAALRPAPQAPVDLGGPVMLLGGGIATYAAAQELIHRGIECWLAVPTEEPFDELRLLHHAYPGERHLHGRLEDILQEVARSPLAKRIKVGELRAVEGHTGDYTVTFAPSAEGGAHSFRAGMVIACLDGQMADLSEAFGHDGQKVVGQSELEERLWTHGVPEGRVVFWINDQEAGHPEFAQLSGRAAWSQACHLRENGTRTQVTILKSQGAPLLLSAAELRRGRELGVNWVTYDQRTSPGIRQGFLTYCDPERHTEEELPYDLLVLSPRRMVGAEATRVARALGLEFAEGEFLHKRGARVRPEMQGRDEAFLAGSACYPCDLQEALRQGRRAAMKTAELMETARQGKLYTPRMVCVVDPEKCVGCGLCKDICACGGIQPVAETRAATPRQVDPMVCVGGGTCAAACPYHALSQRNNSNEQREARVAALAGRLAPGEVLAFGCAWGGAAAADNAGVKGMKYDPRLYLQPVACIGQLDPSVMARAFLEGANHLLLIGCPPEECHDSYGLDHAWSRVNLLKSLLQLAGIDRRRIALAHADLNSPEEYIGAVEGFLTLATELGPITRDDQLQARLEAVYATVNNPRVRWVLGAALRRPWEKDFPRDQQSALAFDHDFLDIIRDEYTRARVLGLLRRQGQAINFAGLAANLGGDKARLVMSLREMASEGLISRTYRAREAFYQTRG